jgi:predicted RNA-binding Zn-ribbon protein involved in translation (DUF1610 family)
VLWHLQHQYSDLPVTEKPDYISVTWDMAPSQPKVDMRETHVFHLTACPECGEKFIDRIRTIKRNTIHSPLDKKFNGESEVFADREVCGYCHERRQTRERVRRYRDRHRQPKEPVACQHCGAAFTPARSTARFCSPKCRVAAHRQAAR